jgi:RNA polymerase sigma-70 factor (ECF subfamily)
LLSKDPDAAEEAFSLFAESVWRYAGSYRGEAPLRAWVYAIARNSAMTIARDGWKKRARRMHTKEAEELADEVRTRTPLRRERQSTLLAELRETLDLDERTLLALRVDEKLSWDEVAQVMSSPEAPVNAPVVRKRFERLKARLGEEARRRGLIE